MKSTFILLFLVLNLYCDDGFINVNFKNLKLMELIKITSLEIDKNILITRAIEGKVNFISNKPIRRVNLLNILKYSLDDNGYKLVNSGDILRVVKKDFLVNKTKKKKKTEKYKKKQINKKSNKKDKILEKMTEILILSNVDANNIKKIINNIVSNRVYSNNSKPSISVDEESNSIILDGTSSEVENLKNIILRLDTQKDQVYVRAKIIELDNNLLDDIGIKFGIFGKKIHSGGLYSFSSNLNSENEIYVDTQSIDLLIPNISSSLALGASLSLLNKTYALDIISEPSLLCLNNKESLIYVGETVSVQTSSTITDGGTTKNSYKREDVGLTLKVKPRISSDNKVMLNINTIVEGIKNINSANFNPNTNKKEVKTSAIVNNGESVILGGLIENKNEKKLKKVPYVGDIPLIGELFKNRLLNNRNKNLIVIVTPYIVPKNKDLTYVRNELSKLKSLEDKFLEEVLLSLKNKDSKTIADIEEENSFLDIQKNQLRLNTSIYKN
ncbi:MAG: general secretion pathway protein GspD [Arcobacter sp.]|nr:general secretion pathway protein GspD [Arcobacter sp.]